ncbi:MAG: hypothetical protein RL378_431, partial [Actinomycetota bacterium]
RSRYRDSYELWHSQELTHYVPFPLTRRMFSVDLESHNTSPFLGERVIGFMSVNSTNKLSLNDSISSLLPQFDAFHVILSNNISERETPTPEKVQFHVLNNGIPEKELKRVLSDLSGYVLLLDENLEYPSDYVARLLTEIEIRDRQVIVGARAMILRRDDEKGSKEKSPVVLHKSMSSPGEWVDLLGSGTIGFHSQTIQLSVAHLKNTSTDNYALAEQAVLARIPQFSINRTSRWMRKASSSMKDLLTRGKVHVMRDDVMSEFQLSRGAHPRSL